MPISEVSSHYSGLINASFAITNNTRLRIKIYIYIFQILIIEYSVFEMDIATSIKDLNLPRNNYIYLCIVCVMKMKTLNVHFFIKFHLRKDSRSTQGRRIQLEC